jgi:hypothetical protein
VLAALQWLTLETATKVRLQYLTQLLLMAAALAVVLILLLHYPLVAKMAVQAVVQTVTPLAQLPELEPQIKALTAEQDEIAMALKRQV